MPKRREPANLPHTPAATPSAAQVEAFASGADQQPAAAAKPDPDATHDFKGIRVGFNEYEYRILEEASRRTGRSKLNFIRHAVLSMAKQQAPD